MAFPLSEIFKTFHNLSVAERDVERERERPSQTRPSPPRAADLVKLFEIRGSRYCFWNLGKSGFLQRGGESRHKEAIFVSQRERER